MGTETQSCSSVSALWQPSGVWEMQLNFIFILPLHMGRKPEIILMGRRREKLLSRCQLHWEKFWRSLAGTPVSSYICVPDIRPVSLDSRPRQMDHLPCVCFFLAPVFQQPSPLDPTLNRSDSYAPGTSCTHASSHTWLPGYQYKDMRE